MKKQNVAIIAVVALVLAVAVGYALFSQTINISGSATAQGSYDVVFQLAADQNDNAFAYSATCNTGFDDCSSGTYTLSNVATLSNSNHTLNITVDKLTYPGAQIVIPFRVKNTGTIDAKLKAITQTGTNNNGASPANASTVVSINYDGPATTNETLAAGAVADGKITIVWDANDTSKNENETLSFTVALEYEQVTVSE